MSIMDPDEVPEDRDYTGWWKLLAIAIFVGGLVALTALAQALTQ